jgi:hypothetical protein
MSEGQEVRKNPMCLSNKRKAEMAEEIGMRENKCGTKSSWREPGSRS